MHGNMGDECHLRPDPHHWLNGFHRPDSTIGSDRLTALVHRFIGQVGITMWIWSARGQFLQIRPKRSNKNKTFESSNQGPLIARNCRKNGAKVAGKCSCINLLYANKVDYVQDAMLGEEVHAAGGRNEGRDS